MRIDGRFCDSGELFQRTEKAKADVLNTMMSGGNGRQECVSSSSDMFTARLAEAWSYAGNKGEAVYTEIDWMQWPERRKQPELIPAWNRT